jgi:hypothetical protein
MPIYKQNHGFWPGWSLHAALLAIAACLCCAAGPGSCETVRTGTLMSKTPYATTYYVKSSGVPGPVVVVIGGLHGNEAAGYLAARKLVHWTITRGTLVVLPDAHKEAIRRNVRAYPANMNNMFPGKANGDAMERLAYEIFEMIRAQHPQLLVTLHESIQFHSVAPKRYGQTLCYDFPRITPLMRRVLARVNPDIKPHLHKFMVFVEPHPTCPTYQSWVKLHVPATSIETCREVPLPLRITYQLMTLEAFFDEVGLGYEQHDVARLGIKRPTAKM